MVDFSKVRLSREKASLGGDVDHFMNFDFRATDSNKTTVLPNDKRAGTVAALPQQTVKATTPYDKLIKQSSEKYGVDERIIRGMIMTESSGDPNATAKTSSAKGLMQTIDDTSADMGIIDPYDPAQSIDGGTRYIKTLLDKYGNVEDALKAYHEGPNDWDKTLAGQRNWSPEGQEHYKRLQENMGGKGSQPEHETQGDADWITSSINKRSRRQDLSNADIGILKAGGKGTAHGTLTLMESVGTASKMVGHRLEGGEMTPWEMLSPVEQAEIGREASNFADQGMEPDQALTAARVRHHYQAVRDRAGVAAFFQNQGRIIEDYWGQKAEGWTVKEWEGKNVVDNPEMLKSPAWWAYNVGDQLPNFAISLGAGGATMKGTKLLAAMTRMSPKNVARVARLGGAVTGGTIAGGLESAGTFRSVIDEGGSPKEALDTAQFMFLFAAGLNSIGVGKLLGKAGPGFVNKVKAKGLNALVESITEGAEEPAEVISIIAGKYTSGEEMPEDIIKMFLDSLKSAATVMGPAAVLGGMSGTGRNTAEESHNENVKDAAEVDKIAARVEKSTGVRTKTDEELEAEKKAKKDAKAGKGDKGSPLDVTGVKAPISTEHAKVLKEHGLWDDKVHEIKDKPVTELKQDAAAVAEQNKATAVANDQKIAEAEADQATTEADVEHFSAFDFQKTEQSAPFQLSPIGTGTALQLQSQTQATPFVLDIVTQAELQEQVRIPERIRQKKASGYTFHVINPETGEVHQGDAQLTSKMAVEQLKKDFKKNGFVVMAIDKDGKNTWTRKRGIPTIIAEKAKESASVEAVKGVDHRVEWLVAQGLPDAGELTEDQLDDVYTKAKAAQGEVVSAPVINEQGNEEGASLSMAQRLEIIAEDVDLAEKRPDAAKSLEDKTQPESISRLAIMTLGGGYFEGDPEAGGWEGMNFTKLTTAALKRMNKVYADAEGHARAEGINPVDSVKGVIIGDQWYSLEFVLTNKKGKGGLNVFQKAEKARKPLTKAQAEGISLQEAKKAVVEEKTEDTGLTKEAMIQFHKSASKGTVKKILRQFRSENTTAKEYSKAKTKDKVRTPDELEGPLLEGLLDFISGRVRTGKKFSNKELVGAGLNKLRKFVSKDQAGRYGMTEDAYRKALDAGGLPSIQGGIAAAGPLDEALAEADREGATEIETGGAVTLDPVYDAAMRKLRFALRAAKPGDPRIGAAIKAKYKTDQLRASLPDAFILDLAEKMLPEKVFAKIMQDFSEGRVKKEIQASKIKLVEPAVHLAEQAQAERKAALASAPAEIGSPGQVNAWAKALPRVKAIVGNEKGEVKLEDVFNALKQFMFTGTFEGLDKETGDLLAESMPIIAQKIKIQRSADSRGKKDGEMYQRIPRSVGILPHGFTSYSQAMEVASDMNLGSHPDVAYAPIKAGDGYVIQKTIYATNPDFLKGRRHFPGGTEDVMAKYGVPLVEMAVDAGLARGRREVQLETAQTLALVQYMRDKQFSKLTGKNIADMKAIFLLDPQYAEFPWRVKRTDPTIKPLHQSPTTLKDGTIVGVEHMMKLKGLKLPWNEFVITQSGVLAAHGIRRNNDIDLIISDTLEKQLEKDGHPKLKKKESKYGGVKWVTEDGLIELFPARTMRIPLQFRDIRRRAARKGKILFENLHDVRRRKLELGRDKDLQDVALLDAAQQGEAEAVTDYDALAEVAARSGAAGVMSISRVGNADVLSGGIKGKATKLGLEGVHPGEVAVTDPTTGTQMYVAWPINKIMADLESALEEMHKDESDMLAKFIAQEKEFWAEHKIAAMRRDAGLKRTAKQERILKEASERNKLARRNQELNRAIAKAQPTRRGRGGMSTTATNLTQDPTITKGEVTVAEKKMGKLAEARDRHAKTATYRVDPAEWDEGTSVMEFLDGNQFAGVTAGDIYKVLPKKYQILVDKNKYKLKEIKAGKIETVAKRFKIAKPKAVKKFEFDPNQEKVKKQLELMMENLPIDIVKVDKGEATAQVLDGPMRGQTVKFEISEEPRKDLENALLAKAAKEIATEPVVEEEVAPASKPSGLVATTSDGQTIEIVENQEANYYDELMADAGVRESLSQDDFNTLLEMSMEATERAETETVLNTEDVSGISMNDIMGNETGLVELDLKALYTVQRDRLKKLAKFMAPFGKNWAETYKKMKAFFDVEAGFKRLAAEATGFHVKNVYSYQEAHEIKFRIQKLDPFKKLIQAHLPNADSQHLADLVFAAEDEAYEDALREAAGDRYDTTYKPLVDYLREFFVEGRTDYQARGVDVDFLARKAFDFTAKLREASDKFLNEDVGTGTEGYNSAIEYALRIKEMQEKLQDLTGLHFVHLPSSFWMADALEDLIPNQTDSKKVFETKRAALLELVSKKRHSLRIADLVRKGLIKKERVNPFEIMMHYGMRQAKDFSFYNIRDAATRDGILTNRKSKPTKGDWVLVPEKMSAMISEKADRTGKTGLTKTWITSEFSDALDAALAGLTPQNKWEKAMSMYKMLRFYNPVFLPIYDIVQQFGLAGMNPMAALPMWYRGFKSLKNKDADWEEAARMGLFSKPFAEPFAKTLQKAKDMADRRGDKFGARAMLRQSRSDLINAVNNGQLGKTAGALAGALPMMYMQASWNAAWYMDNGIRMSTYLFLKKKGHNSFNAAQIAAKAHGDYAGVPAKTRRLLNHVFFTPTFKIAMFKAHKEMVDGVWKVATGKGYGKGSAAMKARRMTWAAAAFIAIQMSFDYLMKTWGYDDDEWGRRYTKTVHTDRGPREHVINWSTPINLWSKYMFRALKVIDPDPTAENPMMDFVSSFSYEWHPMIQTAIRFGRNRQFTGDPIYHEFNTPLQKTGQFIDWFFTKEMFPALNSGLERVGRRRSRSRAEALKLMDEHTNKYFGLLKNGILFTYTRDVPLKRLDFKLQSMRRRFSADIKREYLEYGEFRQDWIKNLENRYKDAVSEFEQRRKKSRK